MHKCIAGGEEQVIETGNNLIQSGKAATAADHNDPIPAIHPGSYPSKKWPPMFETSIFQVI
ncbi:hypothetical protein GA0116948_110112 [Chitinophaga costaii]|uniref:Uncharacterized protein n=1 Tax=Chitinophaga costaii TaxID=1335309 RepID=A0A1C4EY54_9BACT|nr:hypothetical protein GA0116948_110112 [Chitinophaga costaii]